jgi:hypothetical protein
MGLQKRYIVHSQMSEVYLIQGHESEVPLHDMEGVWGSGI